MGGSEARKVDRERIVLIAESSMGRAVGMPSEPSRMTVCSAWDTFDRANNHRKIQSSLGNVQKNLELLFRTEPGELPPAENGPPGRGCQAGYSQED